ncbi:hypothetical protein TNCV_2610071 [Trichonephila clavipes]|nr:hypothetical protein TNCV_2610071 [Trichonephila clavipes]
MLEKVIENWTSRLDYIRASRGSPMPEIIFKIVSNTELISSCGGSLPELSQYLLGKMYNTPFNAIQHLYESIPKGIQDVLDANSSPTPF